MVVVTERLSLVQRKYKPRYNIERIERSGTVPVTLRMRLLGAKWNNENESVPAAAFVARIYGYDGQVVTSGTEYKFAIPIDESSPIYNAWANRFQLFQGVEIVPSSKEQETAARNAAIKEGTMLLQQYIASNPQVSTKSFLSGMLVAGSGGAVLLK